MLFEARPVPKSLRRIARRASFVFFNETAKNKVADKFSEHYENQFGAKPLEVRRESGESIENVIKRAREAFHESMGIGPDDQRIGPGLGQTIVVRGRLSRSDRQALSAHFEAYRPDIRQVTTSRRTNPKSLADQVIADNTTHRPTEPELKALEKIVQSENSPSRASYAINWYVHKTYAEGQRPNLEELQDPNLSMRPPTPENGFHGSTSGVLAGSPDMGRVGSHRRIGHQLAYNTLVDATGRSVDQFPEMPIDGDNSEFKVVRLLHGQEGNTDSKGKVGPYLTIHYPGNPGKNFISKALGHTPSTEWAIPLFEITDEQRAQIGEYHALPNTSHLGMMHGYLSSAVPAVAIDEIANITHRSGFSKRIFDLYNLFELRRAKFMPVVNAVKEMEDKHPSMEGHSEGVAEVFRALCGAVNGLAVEENGKPIWSREQIEGRVMGALAHDVGKIQVKKETLASTKKLQPEEIDEIFGHPKYSDDQLRHYFLPDYVRQMARWHHEWFDGSERGYPDRLQGEQIPLEARVLAVADCVHAMGTDRGYKVPFSLERIKKNLDDESGTHFDPFVVEAFHRIPVHTLVNIFAKYKSPRTGQGLLLTIKDEGKFQHLIDELEQRRKQQGEIGQGKGKN